MILRRLLALITLGIFVLACPARAQLENQLSAYTGPNAEGYLAPLAEAFGANLNDALFHSAEIPSSGLRFSFEVSVMSVLFGDDDKTFRATTEEGFQPQTSVDDAPTVVGSGEARIVNGSGGTTFAFPGGFDLSSFAIAVPQIRFGSIAGTDGLIRFFALDTGDSELGDLLLFGLGVRHSISQYLGPNFPVALAGGVFWQSFSLGDDLIESNAFSIGVQASKRYNVLEPYAGFSFDTFAMDVKYEADTGEKVDLSFDTDTTAHLTLGLGLNLLIGKVFGEYNVADQTSFALGLALGN